MSNVDPIDTLKFVRAKTEDMLEYVHDQIVGTHGDEALSEFLNSMETEVYRAIDEQLSGTQPLVYSDGVSVKTEFRVGNIIHVRWPSHPAQGGGAA